MSYNVRLAHHIDYEIYEEKYMLITLTTCIQSWLFKLYRPSHSNS